MNRLALTYALGRFAFGAATLLAPEPTGRFLAGEGATTPDAQAFLRGMGGREIGLASGLIATLRAGRPPAAWLAAGVLSDLGDISGIAAAWDGLAPDKRGPGIAFGGFAALAGVVVALDAARRS